MSRHVVAKAGRSRPVYRHPPIASRQPILYNGKGIIYRNLKYSDDQPSLETDTKTTIRDLEKQHFMEITSSPLLKQSVVISDKPPKFPMLSHGLDKVIKNYGLHPLKNHRGEFQFPDFLARCPQPDEVDHSAFPRFITSSKDKVRIVLSLILCLKNRSKWS